MSWGAVAGAAIGVVGGAISANSARKGAREQANAGREASADQLTAAREAQAMQAAGIKGGLQMQTPSIYGGNLALSALMGGMGLGPARSGYGNRAPSGDVGGAGGAGMFMNAQGQPVDAQGNVITSSDPYGLMGTNYGATDAEMAAAAAPYAGTFLEQFNGQDIYKDPSYEWRLNEGQRNLRAQQAAGGNRWGGQAMKDITNYAQGAASQEYGAANERFMKNKALLYDRLSGIAGIGNGAGNAGAASLNSGSSTMGQMGMKGAANSSDYLTSAAAANAAGRMGSTNALVGGINTGMNNWLTLNALKGQNKPAPTGGMVQGYDDLWD